MPSQAFNYCIDQAVERRRISKEMAAMIKKAPDPDGAITGIVQTMATQKRQAIISAVRLADAWDKISAHPKGPYAGLLALLSKDRYEMANYANIEYRAKWYEGRYHAMMADTLQRFRTRMLGFKQDEEGLNMLLRGIYGEKVPDPEIQAMANGWLKLVEQTRVEFNKFGGSIVKNQRFLMPQNHDADAIEKVGKAKWKKEIAPLLDIENMLDDTGMPITADQLEQLLDFSYDTIVSRGLNKTKDFAVPRLGTQFAKKHSERRILFFKDADSWLQYQRDYGKGDIFTTLTGHIDTMANDVAKMEILGPAADNNFQALLGQVQKKQKLRGTQKAFINAVWNVVSGKINSGELTSMADFMQSSRNIITASTLGSAFLSAFSDIGFQAITSKYNNMKPLKVLQKHMQLLKDEEMQLFGVQMGLVAENMIGALHAANRYADAYGVGKTAKIADAVMRMSLLSPWTDAGRKAFGMEFSAMLASNRFKHWRQLDEKMIRMFERYGISKFEWERFRLKKTLEHKGAHFVDFTQPEGEKFHRMVMSETDYAVPTPDAKVRAITTWGLQRNTTAGQAARAVMMFKSFPATIIMTHFYRVAMQSTMADKLSYMAAIAATTTVLGAISLQMKDITQGRDLRKIDNWQFLWAAVQQGGGLGIMGDFLFSDQSRFGGGLVETAVGPLGEMFQAGLRLSLGNVQEAARGEEPHVLGEFVKTFGRYTPDTWQTYLFTNAFFDQMEMLVDDRAASKYQRIVRQRKKKYDQEYWWRPDRALPSRAPDLDIIGD